MKTPDEVIEEIAAIAAVNYVQIKAIVVDKKTFFYLEGLARVIDKERQLTLTAPMIDGPRELILNTYSGAIAITASE